MVQDFVKVGKRGFDNKDAHQKFAEGLQIFVCYPLGSNQNAVT